jgi:hypothetical protein
MKLSSVHSACIRVNLHILSIPEVLVLYIVGEIPRKGCPSKSSTDSSVGILFFSYTFFVLRSLVVKSAKVCIRFRTMTYSLSNFSRCVRVLPIAFYLYLQLRHCAPVHCVCRTFSDFVIPSLLAFMAALPSFRSSQSFSCFT